MAELPIAIGETVVLTELGKKRHPRLRERSASVKGRSRRYRHTWFVLFEGNSTLQAIHESYIRVKIIQGEDQS